MTKAELELNAKLHQKIEAVSNEIGYQEKKDTNSFSRYKFTGNEQMMGAVRMALTKHKLSLTCDMVDYQEKDFVVPNAKGQDKYTIRSIVNIKVTVTDTETGYSIVSSGIGAEQDTGGKSMQQAITQAFKYWIFKNFKVSSQMETDPDSKTTEVKAPAQPTKAQILAKLAKCTTVACITKIYNVHGGMAGIKEACTKQRKLIESQSKTK